MCTVTASRSPPKAWPTVTVPASRGATAATVRLNHSGSAPPSVITYETRVVGRAASTPARTAGSEECR